MVFLTLFRDSSWMLIRLVCRQRFRINRSTCWLNENRISSSAPHSQTNGPIFTTFYISYLILCQKVWNNLKGRIWVAPLLGTLLGVQDHKKSNFHVQYCTVQWYLKLFFNLGCNSITGYILVHETRRSWS